MRTDFSVAGMTGQAEDEVRIGVDMGRGKWVACVRDGARPGRSSSFRFTGDSYMRDCCEKVRGYVAAGKRVRVVYEIGRNGFTPARLFRRLGAEVTVIPVNRLEIVKKGRKAKTDRLDARFLSGLDIDSPGFPAVWVPSERDECRRGMLRERRRLGEDIKRINNRILSILERWPVPPQRGHQASSAWEHLMEAWRGSGVVPELLPEVEELQIGNMIRELAAVEKNLAEWNRRIDRELAGEAREAASSGQPAVTEVLVEYRSIGREIATGLAWYVGDFRRFAGAKRFTAYLGLTPTPWDSNRKTREQGISKAGCAEVRRLMVELAWLWSRHQPDSPITRKWQARLAQKGRIRRIAIVAMARELAVALFRRVRDGRELEGAVKNRLRAVPARVPRSPLAA